MYSVLFEADNGRKYLFGEGGSTVFDMDLGAGVSVGIGTSQGFSQIGESVESQTVSGKPITVKGVVYGDIPGRKKAMRNALAPFTSGRLVFNSEYYIQVYVKESPTFSVIKGDGRFTMQFYAPFPFFYTMDEKAVYIGAVVPGFRFPVNYSQPHRFGTRAAARYKNIVNDGDVKVPFGLSIHSSGECANVTVTNLSTLAYLKLNGTLNAGESIRIYREDDGVLRAELTTDEGTSDAISWIDEGSTLFELDVGDNLISATDDSGGASLTASFLYREAVAAVYET